MDRFGWIDVLPSSPDKYREAGKLIHGICGPIILVLGTFGNLLSILVFCSASNRRRRSSIYFIVLAVADMLTIFIYTPFAMLEYASLNGFHPLNSLFCKLQWFAYFTMADFSVWILVLLTVDRTTTACSHMQGPLIGRKCVFLGLALAFLVLSALNFHIVIGRTLKEDVDGYTYCEYEGSASYTFFIKKIWHWLDLTAYWLLPAIIITVCDVFLIRHIIRTRRNTIEASGRETSDRHQNVRSRTSIIVMLVATDIQFIVLTSPVLIAALVYGDGVEYDDIDPEQKLLYRCFQILCQFNNALNFFTYCLSGANFRRDLYKRCFRRKSNNNSTVDSVSVSRTPSNINMRTPLIR